MYKTRDCSFSPLSQFNLSFAHGCKVSVPPSSALAQPALSVVALRLLQGFVHGSRGRGGFDPGDGEQGGGGGCRHGNLNHLLILDQSNEGFETFQ